VLIYSDDQSRAVAAPSPSQVVTDRGKGGHVMVKLGNRRAIVATGSGEIPPGTFAAILKQLGLRREQL
jgi:hypothetical protein